jgi:anti-sigma factor RsiW
VTSRWDPAGSEPSEHEQLHELLGAFVLGGLEPEEHRAFSRHLRTCPECQREAGQVSGLPALLELARPAGQPAPAVEGAGEVGPPVSLTARIQRDRRRRRFASAGLVAAVAVLCLVVGFVTRPLVVDDNPPAVVSQGTTVAAVGVGSSPVQGAVTVVNKQWGTQLELQAGQLPTTGTMALWVVESDGHTYKVATWFATPAGRTSLTAACAVRSEEIASVEIRTGTGTRIAAAKVHG